MINFRLLDDEQFPYDIKAIFEPVDEAALNQFFQQMQLDHKELVDLVKQAWPHLTYGEKQEILNNDG